MVPAVWKTQQNLMSIFLSIFVQSNLSRFKVVVEARSNCHNQVCSILFYFLSGIGLKQNGYIIKSKL